jgi:uncharacterized protein YdaU (DUF1376 family)
MKETYYLKHDANVRSDDKIKDLLRVHGALGYGIYWMIIEDMRNSSTISFPTSSIPTLAFDYRVDEKLLSSVVYDFRLFTVKQEQFYSERLRRDVKNYRSKTEKAKSAAKSRWDKDNRRCERNADAMQTHSKRNAIIGDNIRGNKIKEKVREYVLLSPSELDTLKKEFGEEHTNLLLDILDNYKGSKGKKYKDDYRAIRSWVIKAAEEKKSKGTVTQTKMVY